MSIRWNGSRWVPHDLVVLFQPPVEGPEVEDDVVVEFGVASLEAGAWSHLPRTRRDGERLPRRGVDGERDARMQHARAIRVGRRPAVDGRQLC